MQPKEFISSKEINKYFDGIRISPGQIKPGMILSFAYRSPDRAIHDPIPLIYVLERKGDRVYGLNLHYDFKLIGPIIAEKRRELERKVGLNSAEEEQNRRKQDVIISAREKTNVIGASSHTRDDQNQDNQHAKKKVVIPQQLLEIYDLKAKPKDILRNYMYRRMTNLLKLSYKPY